MRSSSVQFRGIKQVLNAYVQNDMPAWSLWWSPRDLMAKYEGKSISEGEGQLQAALKLLVDGGSEASYMLRVYEDLPKGGRINSATPYSGSFNFGLFDFQGSQVGGLSPYQQRQASVIGVIDTRFQELQDKYLAKIMAKMEEEGEEKEEKPGGVMGVIGALLENPSIQQALMAKLSGWLGAPAIIPQPAQVAGLDEGVKISQEQYEKLEEAVNILAACDPLIGDHLLGLAKIARDNPSKYKMALTFL